MSDVILAIETSGKVCSAAIATLDGNVVAEYNINIGNKHDKFCAELCRRLLTDNDVAIPSNINTNISLPANYTLAAVAVSIGPGSFTGLRIGVAIAKGLCFDGTIKLCAVPTLSAIAQNVSKYLSVSSCTRPDIVAVIPSHSNLCYYQVFNGDDAQPLTDVVLDNIDAIRKNVEERFGIIVSNHPISAFAEHNLYPNCFRSISAAAVAEYAAKQYSEGIFADATTLIPMYMQDFIPS
jgi:tRNA threonylcarbamoyladenosine biosynthesis protein TsaB